MKALKVVGTIGRFALAGALIVWHFVMNIIGALICAIIHKVKTENYYGKERNNAAQSGKKKLRGT